VNLANESPREASIKGKANLLLPYWNGDTDGGDGCAAKEQVVAEVTKAILRAADRRPSKGCRYLLPFLLNCETRNLGRLLTEIESHQVRDLTRGLAIIADTEGASTNSDAHEGFRRFMEMPGGDQLLAIVELRNNLEQWAMSPETASNSPYDLTGFRSDLRAYFLPQQWKGTRKPTARDMYKIACELDGDRSSEDTREFLRTMTWLLRAAHAGNRDAGASVGYYFLRAGDFRRYAYWTKKSARQGSCQALFNLGESYLDGTDGFKQSSRTALQYFLRAYKHGFKLALVEIGHCYMRLRDYKKAKHWLEKAVIQTGHRYAYFKLGWMYEKGWGVSKSKAVALDYYIIGGELGDENCRKATQRLGS
jgi:hypothetical protein